MSHTNFDKIKDHITLEKLAKYCICGHGSGRDKWYSSSVVNGIFDFYDEAFEETIKFFKQPAEE